MFSYIKNVEWLIKDFLKMKKKTIFKLVELVKLGERK